MKTFAKQHTDTNKSSSTQPVDCIYILARQCITSAGQRPCVLQVVKHPCNTLSHTELFCATTSSSIEEHTYVHRCFVEHAAEWGTTSSAWKHEMIKMRRMVMPVKSHKNVQIFLPLSWVQTEKIQQRTMKNGSSGIHRIVPFGINEAYWTTGVMWPRSCRLDKVVRCSVQRIASTIKSAARTRTFFIYYRLTKRLVADQ